MSETLPNGSDSKDKPAMRNEPEDEAIERGQLRYSKMGWKRLTVCLIVEAIALGALSLPAAFAQVGMIAGVILTVGLGVIAIYTAYLVGQVKLKYPLVENYAEAVQLIWGRFGYWLASIMFVLLLVFTTGSHVLTGTIALVYIVDAPTICALVWGIASGVLLFLLALPPSFHEFAILGYIDFASIVIAIIITMIATGIQSSASSGPIASTAWSLWPPEGSDFSACLSACTNIVFAYSFAVGQFSFMAEMHDPEDFVKSIVSLGLIEIIIYTLTGSLIYAFVGANVSSPALLSAGKLVARVAFGFALPVIFISGSMCTTITGRYILNSVYKDSSVRFVDTPRAWAIWTGLIALLTLISWIIAEAIPIFNGLLSLMVSLFVTGFTFYFPALFWFSLLREGRWYDGWKNICLSILNGIILWMGLFVLVAGAYATVQVIISGFQTGNMRRPFTCASSQYT